MQNKAFHSGFVAIIGRPNVGKSSIMNYFVGEKVAIVSNKPQTTRNKILGVTTAPLSGTVSKVVVISSARGRGTPFSMGFSRVRSRTSASPGS